MKTSQSIIRVLLAITVALTFSYIFTELINNQLIITKRSILTAQVLLELKEQVDPDTVKAIFVKAGESYREKQMEIPDGISIINKFTIALLLNACLFISADIVHLVRSVIGRNK